MEDSGFKCFLKYCVRNLVQAAEIFLDKVFIIFYISLGLNVLGVRKVISSFSLLSCQWLLFLLGMRFVF